MPRPKKCRRVGFIPDNQCFRPQLNNSGEVVLTVEEFEALRLSDYLGLEQDHAALNMNVSRGTFQRIINTARKKTADALVNGKILRIDGGNYRLSSGKSCCRRIQGICEKLNCEKCGVREENKFEVNKNE